PGLDTARRERRATGVDVGRVDGRASDSSRRRFGRNAALADRRMTASSRATWDAIVQRALLGTDRASAAAPPQAPDDLHAVVSRVDARDVESALLASAAIVGAYESAG